MEIRRLYVVARPGEERAIRALAILKGWSGAKGIEAITVDREGKAPRIQGGGALVVALGGDGTVLRAASLFAESGLPILGANVGNLGFLTQVPAASLTLALEEVLQGRCRVEERMRLSFQCGSRKGTVLNDVVVAAPADSRFCELDLLWKGETIATCPGDGLVLATPTGSTAYALSAGGPVLLPEARAILAVPIAPHKLGLRPVVFQPGETLVVHARSAACLFADGDPILDLPVDADVEVRESPLPTRLVRMHDAPPFFRLLGEKLAWGDSRPRKLKG